MSGRSACRGIGLLLAVVTAVPLGAVAAESAPLPPAPGRVVEPWPGAAGGPRPSWPVGGPGVRMPQALSVPVDTRAGGRSMRDIPAIGRRPRDTPPDRQGPGAATAAGFAPVASGSPGAGPGRCGGRRGVRQREAERWLKLRVDGKQSAGDCRAIRAFQRKHGVEPADGTAGPATWARMRALSAGEAPHERRERHERHEPEKGHKSHKGNKSHRGNEGYEGHKGHKRVLRGCPVRSYRVACVDLTRKRTWVQQRGRILYGPVPMRSGSVRHPTRTGWFRIYLRNRNHWSTLYNSPMPYAQFFSGGQAFHAVRGSIRTVGGSMGCVNLRLADARGLWKVLRKGDRVYVWGRRPRR